MKFYTKLFNAVFFGEYQKWKENFFKQVLG